MLAGTQPGSILAITFTEKAAAEMHERLHAQVRAWSVSADDQLDDELRQIGQNALNPAVRARAHGLYEKLLYAENKVQVMTFHAFCRKILERFPSYSDVPAGFDVCEDAAELQRLSFERLMEEAAEESALRQTLDRLSQACRGLGNMKKSLFSFLNHRTEWLGYTEGRDHAVDWANQRLRRALNPEAIKKPSGVERPQIERLTRLQDVFAACGGKRCDHLAASIARFLRHRQLNLDTLHELKKVLTSKSGLAAIEKRQKNMDARQSDMLTELHEQLCAWARRTENQLLIDAASRRNQAWYAAGQRITEIYRQLKRERQVLDFDDLEWHARQLIVKSRYAPWIIYCLNERIRHILVDEFQDTNPEQWQLLKPFLEEVKAGGDGSVLIVGDTKQSIFGFRRANPRLQKLAGDWIKDNMNGQIHTMNESRRSSPAIIDFVNEVFQPAEGEEAPLLADFQRGGSALDTPGKVFCLPFIDGERERGKPGREEWRAILQTPMKEAKPDPARQEGERIAAAIQKIIKQEWEVRLFKQPPRAVRYSDILILLRRTNRIAQLQSALRQAGINFYSSHDENLLQSPEARDLLSLIKLLINPNDNLAMAETLKSPIFCADDNRLMMLENDKPHYRQLKSLARGDTQWRIIYQQLNRWIDWRDRRPVHDLLSRIYHSQDLIMRYRSLAAADRREHSEQALYALLEYTLSFNQGRWTSLQGFAAELQRQIEHGESGGGEAFSPSQNKLRLMTVHKSKGLEAAVVFVADCGIHRAPADSYRALLEWGGSEDRPQNFLLSPHSHENDPLSRRCLKEQKNRNELEEMNLLYVALTRARQYLFISGHGAQESPQQTSWYKLAVGRGQAALFDDFQAPEQQGEGDSEDRAMWLKRKPIRFALRKNHEELSPSRLSSPHEDRKRQSHWEDDDQLIRGQAIHKALELISGKRQPKQILRQLSNEFSLLGGKEIANYCRQAQAIHSDAQFAELFDDDRFDKVYNEMPLSYRQSDQLYYGVVDRLCVAADWIWLVDYKTHRHAKGRLHELCELYEGQMRAYCQGAEKLWPQKRVRLALLFTGVPTLYEYPDKR